MKKILILLIMGVFLTGTAAPSFASDWDKAGKALTIIEGLRLITGGRVDVVGSIAGIGKKSDGEYAHVKYRKDRQHHRRHKHKVKRQYICTIERAWVPHYEWRTKHIPSHATYDDELGKILVEEHYVKYKVKQGGHWEETEECI